MTDISSVVRWKLNNPVDLDIHDGVITKFPGTIPTQQDIDDWTPEYELHSASTTKIDDINDSRDVKKTLPILTEGEQVDAGTLSSGAMANELFAYDGKTMTINSITRSGSIASVTFAKNHHLDTGQSFTPSGADQLEYNDDFVVTVTGKKTLDVTVSGAPTTPATGNITALTKDYPWIDHLNNTVFWTASKFKAIHRDTTKYERDCVRHGRTLKDSVLDATTVAEVEAIDIEADWPDTGI